jgi:hypothetical protein
MTLSTRHSSWTQIRGPTKGPENVGKFLPVDEAQKHRMTCFKYMSNGFLDAFAKLPKATINFVTSRLSVCLSVLPHGKTWLATGRILIKLDFHVFPKIR